MRMGMIVSIVIGSFLIVFSQTPLFVSLFPSCTFQIQISFNELRHILNLAQILAMRKQGSYVSPEATQNYMNASISVQGNDDLDSGENLQDLEKTSNGKKKPQSSVAKDKPSTFDGPAMITFDGDQTLYTDGANFDSNPRLARYILELLRNGVVVAVVTAAGYEYNVEKYEYRLSGLLNYFKDQGLLRKSVNGSSCSVVNVITLST